METNGLEAAVQSLLAWKTAAVGLWLLLFFAGERLSAAATEPAETGPLPDGPLPDGPHPNGPHPNGRRRDGPLARLAHRLGRWRRPARNLTLWSLNLPLSLLVVVPATEWASVTALDWRPAWWAGWGGLLLDLLLLDLWIYWWHRANHLVPFFWRFHSVHHLDRFLDSSSALRFHFGEVALSCLVRAAVILLLGFPLASVLVFETLVLLASIFHHSNLRLPQRLERPLSWLVVTPSIHWVHHHRIRRDTDSNYATILSLWDRLFASRSRTRRAPDMEIGVEGEAEETLPRLLLRPFQPGR